MRGGDFNSKEVELIREKLDNLITTKWAGARGLGRAGPGRAAGSRRVRSCRAGPQTPRPHHHAPQHAQPFAHRCHAACIRPVCHGHYHGLMMSSTSYRPAPYHHVLLYRQARGVPGQPDGRRLHAQEEQVAGQGPRLDPGGWSLREGKKRARALQGGSSRCRSACVPLPPGPAGAKQREASGPADDVTRCWCRHSAFANRRTPWRGSTVLARRHPRPSTHPCM